MKYGLQDSEVEQIQKVFSAHPEVEKAILYGSRAKGNFRPASDVDITLCGNRLNLSLLLSLENELDDLFLPYKIDLSIFHSIENTDLLDHIKRVGIILFESGQK